MSWRTVAKLAALAAIVVAVHWHGYMLGLEDRAEPEEARR